jgi:hypothetical protein
VHVVQTAVNDLDFRNRRLFPEWQADALKAARTNRQVLGQIVVVNGIPQPIYVALSFHLGQVVFNKIPLLLQWIPFNDVHFVARGNDIKVIVRSLQRSNGPHGTIYYSRHEPILEIDGQQKIVAFSEHAIKQACDRVVPTWRTYRGLGDAFALFDQTVFFERADFYDGQLAFTFYDKCDYGFQCGQYVEDVFGGWNGTYEGYYYRVGYCPAVVEGDFIKAKTLLFPGQHPTPEYGLIAHSRLPRDEKQRLREQVRTLDKATLRESGDMSLIKWFHDQGIPQVVYTKQTIQMPPW